MSKVAATVNVAFFPARFSLDVPTSIMGLAQTPPRSEPPAQRVSEPQLGQVSHPGHIPVGPNQHGSGSWDRPEYRKLPRTNVCGVDQLNPICPWSDVQAAGLTKVE
jgi:hypothetical protein